MTKKSSGDYVSRYSNPIKANGKIVGYTELWRAKVTVPAPLRDRLPARLEKSLPNATTREEAIEQSRELVAAWLDRIAKAWGETAVNIRIDAVMKIDKASQDAFRRDLRAIFRDHGVLIDVDVAKRIKDVTMAGQREAQKARNDAKSKGKS